MVDDNAELLLALELMLKPIFSSVKTLQNPEQMTTYLEGMDLVLLDMNFKSGQNSGNEGLFWLAKIREQRPETSVVFITAYGDTQLAVEAIRQGAIDFIEKSWSHDKMLATILSAFRYHVTKSRLETLEKKQGHLREVALEQPEVYHSRSPVMQEFEELVERVAPTDASILILGENGTGKEVYARRIHDLSHRSDELFVKVDLGSINPNLFESELFGHVKGAFTDARADKVGRVEVASGGTLFLDEIGNLTLEMQQKLLSMIQNQEIYPVGRSSSVKVDIRIVCATNQPLYEMVEAGTFREDLLYRINTIQLDVPPLRSREQDIVPMAEYFVGVYARKYDKEATISSVAKEKLKKHAWRGNVRELMHAVEKATILSTGSELSSSDFRLAQRGEPALDTFNLEENERRIIAQALGTFQWNISKTARALGINRSTLYDKIDKYGLEEL